LQKKKLSFLHKSSLKHLATAERKPNEKFIKTVFSKFLKTILEYSLETRKIDAWHLHEDYCPVAKCKASSFIKNI
jgi:N utilization substance protein B